MLKEYRLKGDQIFSPPYQPEVERKSEAETRPRGEAIEFREAARHLDTQLAYGKVLFYSPLNIFFEIIWSDEKKLNHEGHDGFACH